MKTLFRSLVLVSFTLIAQLALAVQPIVQHIPIDWTWQDDRCGFTVSMHITGTIVDISYTDAQGLFHDFQASPQATQVMTNVASGKSITFNVAGTGTYTYDADGSFTMVATGNWSWGEDPDSPPLHRTEGWWLTHGRVVQFIHASGYETLSRTGKKTDLCDLVR